MKAGFLLIITNIAVMVMIAIVVRLLGLEPVLQQNGTNIYALFIFSAVMGFAGSFISLLMSKSLAKRGMGVQVIDTPRNEVETWIKHTVEHMADELGIKTPECGIFDNPTPNAFATGPSKNNALVAVSSGLLQAMNKEEVEAVIGHEMAHVKNGDMVTSTLLQGLMNTFVYFFARIIAQAVSRGDGRNSAGMYFMVSIVMQIVLGLLASLVVRWHSRWREYHADAGGASLTSNKNMADALRALLRMKEAGATKPLPDQMAAFGITNLVSFGGLFSTHPPLEKRIHALEQSDVIRQ